MSIRKFAVTALLTVAATGVTAATVNAEPAAVEPSVRAVDRGVAYTAGLSSDHRGITTTLQSGRFELTRDDAAVSVVAPDGNVIQQLPMSFQAAGRKFRLNPQIGSSGRTLTLDTVDLPSAEVKDVQAFQANVSQAQDVVLLGVLPGVTIGGLIGGVIGALVGLLFFVVGAIPGALIGAVIGAIIGGVIA